MQIRGKIISRMRVSFSKKNVTCDGGKCIDFTFSLLLVLDARCRIRDTAGNATFEPSPADRSRLPSCFW